MNPFLIRAVLFDFDGVLADSETIRFRATVQALTEIGVSLSRETFRAQWLGRTDEAALRDLLGERFGRDGKRFLERRHALYEERMDEVEPFTDAAQFIRRLPQDIRLAIASGSRRVEVESLLWRAAMTESFRTLVTAEDYGRAKPAPDAFQAAARLLDLCPAACLVIEGSTAGIAAAQAAGMPVAAVNRGPGHRGFAGATWVVASLDEISLTPAGEVEIRTEQARAA
jgi:beta-phosphoglucomutase